MKTAIVFGGSGYLGSHIVRFLVNSGYRAVVTYCAHEPQFEKEVLPCLAFMRCDIAENEEVAAVFSFARKTFGTPDVVINAAGTALKQRLLADIRPEEIDKLFAVDLLGALYISREAAIALHEKQAGSIIHISSLWGSMGASCEVPYSAAKGGLNAMVKALAKELAPDGIRVNAVAPGLLLSPMNAHLSEEELALFKEETPLNCYITPEDVNRALEYLLICEHVTGQILAVDGGIVM